MPCKYAEGKVCDQVQERVEWVDVANGLMDGAERIQRDAVSLGGAVDNWPIGSLVGQ